MNKPWLVNIGSTLALKSIKWGLPFAETAIKNTIFEQFCGGTNLLSTVPAIEILHKYGIYAILDYGAEGKETEKDFNQTMVETLRAIEFAESQKGKVPVVSTKLTGMVRFDLLMKLNEGKPLEKSETTEYETFLKRIDSICHLAHEKKIGIFIDAEESWIQNPIDHVANLMMERYNKERVIVYNTFQLYRHDRLAYLKHSFEESKSKNYMMGAKLVRGAYMEKERNRALELGYPSPIQVDKLSTDKDFDNAIRFCVDHYETLGSCNATHNISSNKLQAELIKSRNIQINHPHLNFCQLYGMSDNITYNLGAAGYNVAKYVVYGSVHDVIPYLIRRAQENTSVTGDMSREYQMIEKEMKRRNLV
ncbi:MAG: proline dehydrogenase family protein [Saprospiraceae bacterium]|nr:proline dehydrogenase family protein [Saprospiraceae bacterium]